MTASADDEEAYSPGSSTSSGSAPAATSLRNKMEELNRQIEEQKQQILKMAQADSSILDPSVCIIFIFLVTFHKCNL